MWRYKKTKLEGSIIGLYKAIDIISNPKEYKIKCIKKTTRMKFYKDKKIDSNYSNEYLDMSMTEYLKPLNY